MSPSSHQGDRKILLEVPPGNVRVIATAFLNAVGKQFPSSQEKRGDDKLALARDLVPDDEVLSMIGENDLKVIEDKIAL